jgi:hypothetical protein
VTKPTDKPSTPKPAKPKRVRVLSADTVITFRAGLDDGGRIDAARGKLADLVRAIAAEHRLSFDVVPKPKTAPMVNAEPSGGEG